MPKKKEPLCERLDVMSDDIQIGGQTCFKAMSLVAALCEPSDALTAEQKRDMELLLARASRLLRALNQFWRDHPDLDEIADRKTLASRL